MRRLLLIIGLALAALRAPAAPYLGDWVEDSTHDLTFTSVSTTGAPTQLAGSPVVKCYKANSTTTEISTGITLTVDFDSVTGLNHVRVDTSADAFYATGADYRLIITTGTVGGTSVVGYCVGEFSIENRFQEADVVKIAGSAVNTASAQLGVNVVNFGGSAGTFASGRPEVNVSHWKGTAAATADTAGYPVVTIKDGTGAGEIALTSGAVDSVAAVSGAVGSVTGAVGSVTGNVGGNVTGSVGSVASGGITAASIAADAIGADEIAADAIGASEIAANAIGASEVADGAVDAGALADDSIDAAAIATDAVGAAEIAAAAIGASEIATDAVGAAEVAADAVTEIQTGLATAAAVAALNNISAADVWAAGTRTLTAIDEDATTLDLNATAIGSVTGAVGSVTTVGDKTGYSLANVDGLAFADYMESILAVLFGVSDNPSGATWTFKKRDGTTTKVTIELGSPTGERSSSTVTP